jgi:ubiquinone/menaquinone biosynthesis C-methylase UbiE
MSAFSAREDLDAPNQAGHRGDQEGRFMATPTQPIGTAQLDVEDLRGKVQHMYEAVARHPHDGHFHFEMGRAMAERLGYPATDLDRVPAPAIESFAGVGYYFDLAALQPGERVVDLGSGSGMDALMAALYVGPSGRVIGIDMTDAQREKASGLALAAGFVQAEFRPGLIEEIPVGAGEADCVISNGVINLCPDKERVFAEAARVLRPGGRLAIADIVTDLPLPPNVTCNATLWAACIGGAAQQDAYRAAIEAAGLRVVSARENSAYAFLSKSAKNASQEYGVKSISLVAVKEKA